MRLSSALTDAIKYHLVALVPTGIGFAVAGVALWFGLIQPVLDTAVLSGNPQQILQSVANAPISPVLIGVGVVVGLFVRRVGRTALLFKLHGSTVVDVVDREVVPGEPERGDGSHGEGTDSGSATDEPVTDESVTDETATDVSEPDEAEDSTGGDGPETV
ncbi:hypothetical protein EKH57_00610 [Halorubrum sp. BOL3-1]|uniref:hypothetical protein n=1 Tax=Halorubrum sp. BOL3-1 TaxID=2497325 RepID=UPI0010050FD1|nr:hypothetical protein [Halorubrum sp. BOL3-1]QAU11412.1 hypothetical protein EKH57_00610 [Halorubrum sp. BOL3-1]